MKEDIKQQWVEALNSGNYPQIKNALHRDEGFCCLGVLCDLHAKATGGEWCAEEHLGGSRTYQGYGGVPPESVWEWAGMTGEDDEHIGGLIRRNDAGQPFTMIAARIQEAF